MDSWGIFIVAFAAVVGQAWIRSNGAPGWYMDCIIPLLYGGVVAWMFLGRDFTLAFQIIVFGAVLPIALLVRLWRRDRGEEHSEETQDPPREQEP